VFRIKVLSYHLQQIIESIKFDKMVESSGNNVLTTGGEANIMPLDRSWFIQSRRGNIKDQYFFEKKLGSGGYGAVYLALNK